MSVLVTSRYLFSVGQQDANGRFFLSDRQPFRFVNLSDNRQHFVVQGDTLFNLAARYFQGLARPAGFWWVIADFQPQPILDPTLRLLEGSTIVVPSLKTLTTRVFNSKRRPSV